MTEAHLTLQHGTKVVADVPGTVTDDNALSRALDIFEVMPVRDVEFR